MKRGHLVLLGVLALTLTACGTVASQRDTPPGPLATARAVLGAAQARATAIVAAGSRQPTPPATPAWLVSVHGSGSSDDSESGWTDVSFNLAVENGGGAILNSADFQNAATVQARWRNYTYDGGLTMPSAYLPHGYRVAAVAQVRVPSVALRGARFRLVSPAGASDLRLGVRYTPMPPLPTSRADQLRLGDSFGVPGYQTITVVPQTVGEPLQSGAAVSNWALHARWHNLGGADAQLGLTFQLMAGNQAQTLSASGDSVAPGLWGDALLQLPFIASTQDYQLLVMDQRIGAYGVYSFRATPPSEAWSITPQQSGTGSDLVAAAFSDGEHGWAQSGFGPLTLVQTSNGGTSWYPQSQSSFSDVHAISFPSYSNGWIVGERGTILHSTDGGSTWSSQYSNSQGALDGVAFSDIYRGCAVGQSPGVWCTFDGGNTWTAETDGSQGALATGGALRAVTFADYNTGWAVGDAGTILGTGDGGQTWSVDNDTGFDLFAVSAPTIADIWAVGASGTIMASSDGGSTWATQTSGVSGDLHGVAFQDTMHGWAVGQGGTILYTGDGGTTWQFINNSISADLEAVVFGDSTDAWIVGTGGTILHISTLQQATP